MLILLLYPIDYFGHYSDFESFLCNIAIQVAGQWSDQEPLSPWLATGNSPASYWSTLLNVLIHVSYVLYVCMHV